MKFILFRAIILLTFGVVAFQLFQIQINFGDTYQRLAENNRFRLISDEAPRGTVTGEETAKPRRLGDP